MLPSLVVTVTFVINFYSALGIKSRQNRMKKGYLYVKIITRYLVIFPDCYVRIFGQI